MDTQFKHELTFLLRMRIISGCGQEWSPVCYIRFRYNISESHINIEDSYFHIGVRHKTPI